MRRIHWKSTLIFAALAFACATPVDHAEKRERLGLAASRIEASDLKGSAHALEAMLSDEAPRDEAESLQRFYAATLLVRAHLAAAFGQPFVSSPEPARGADWNLDAKSAASRTPSPIAHLVAAIYHASYAREWYPTVKKSSPKNAGELLPHDLESFSARNALAYLNLAMLSAYSRLNFQDRVEAIVEGMPELASIDGCDALIAETRSTDGMKPWIFKGVFEHLKHVDEPGAYKFAIRTLDASPKTSGAPNANELALIAHWITSDSRYVFKCPTCKTLVDPALAACTVCRRPNIEFEPELREGSR